MPAPRAPNKPGLVQHLNAQAPAKPVNNIMSVQMYYQSASLLLQQAAQYRRAENAEQLYVMLLRFASLVIETIPQHKDATRSDPQYVKYKKLLSDQLLPELERLRMAIKLRDEPEPMARSLYHPPAASQLSTSNLDQLNWGPAPPPPPPPQPQVEFQVEDLLDIISNGPGPASHPSGPPAPSAPPLPPPAWGPHGSAPSPAVRSDPPGTSSGALQLPPAYTPKYASSSTNAASRHALFYNTGSSSAGAGSSSAASAAGALAGMGRSSSMGGGPAGPRYPDLGQLGLSDKPPPPPPLPPPSAGPPLPPQEVQVFSMSPDQPGLPGTCAMHPPQGTQYPQAPSLQLHTPYPQPPQGGPGAVPPPPPPPPPQPRPGEAGPAAAAAGGVKELVKRAQLRDVHVSLALMEQFLAVAANNTRRGIEFCGILAGRLSANESIFTVTTLIIPQQEGTSDTVQALNEEDIFEAQFQNELYPLGWIHTHPTQTCFLSSIDVHTQCGYQTMLDEAIAIVMAPTDRTKRCGLFRLSTPGGLQLVQKCERRGFHMHPDTSTGQELYELCGHVYINEGAKHEVIDLRKG